MYITLAGYSMLAQASAMFAYNDFMNVPRIIQFAPNYYDAHIADNPHYGHGGAGSANSWGDSGPDW